jgi:hypothetical protein
MVQTKIRNILLASSLITFSLGLFLIMTPTNVYANHGDLHCNDGTPVEAPSRYPGYSTDFCEDKDGVNSEAGCGDCDAGSSGSFETDCENGLDPSNCEISRYLTTFTRVLTALVGIVITIMIVVGGIQYSAARDNPQAVQAAKGHIINALLALLAYIFMFAFLQWIVPGGVI